MWVRVIRHSIEFEGRELFRKLGDRCGNFVAVDEGHRSELNLQWARILVKSDVRNIPGTMQ